MTSTSYNVGVGDLKRPTSKVLKPPGGGSSDIFGATESGNPQPERRSKNHNQSSLPFGDSDSTDTASVKSDGAPSSGDESSKPKERTVSNSSSENNRPAATTPARNRVPPGGFSSGLW